MFFLFPVFSAISYPGVCGGYFQCFFLFPVFSAISYPGICGVTYRSYSVFSCSQYSVLSANQGFVGLLTVFFLVSTIWCYQLPKGLWGDLHCFFLFQVFGAISYPGVCGVTYSVFSCSQYSVPPATQGSVLWGDLQCFFLFPVFSAISYPGVCGVTYSVFSCSKYSVLSATQGFVG